MLKDRSMMSHSMLGHEDIAYKMMEERVTQAKNLNEKLMVELDRFKMRNKELETQIDLLKIEKSANSAL